MLWFKTFHIFAMVAWFAGIFYLPRLFVYHVEADDAISHARFKVMERRLYYGITTPSAVATIVLGLVLMSYNWSAYLHAGWMHAKLSLVVLLIAYHIYCGVLLHGFKHDRNRYSSRFYRIFNELPVFLLIGIVAMVIVRPF